MDETVCKVSCEVLSSLQIKVSCSNRLSGECSYHDCRWGLWLIYYQNIVDYPGCNNLINQTDINVAN